MARGGKNPNFQKKRFLVEGFLGFCLGFCTQIDGFLLFECIFMTVRSGNEVRVKSRTALFKKSTGMDTNKAVICCSALGTHRLLPFWTLPRENSRNQKSEIENLGLKSYVSGYIFFDLRRFE